MPEEHSMLEVALNQSGRADHVLMEQLPPASLQVGQLRDSLMPNIAYSPRLLCMVGCRKVSDQVKPF